MPRLKVSLKPIWTGPKQNKDFTPQELQVLFCKFLMKHIATCCAEGVLFSCSHHRIFITRLQNWFLQREASLPLWKSNSPILMYINLLYYREENFFSYQTNYEILLIEALIRFAGQTVPMFVFSWSTLCILYSYKEVLQENVCHIVLIFCTSQSLVTREIWTPRKESSSIERSSDCMLALRKTPYKSTFQLEIL